MIMDVRKAGVRGASVRAALVMIAIIALSSSATARAERRAADRCPSVEITKVLDKTAPGGRTVGAPDRRLRVSRTPILTGTDVRAARVTYEGGEFNLLLDFTAAAGERLQTYTAAHPGMRIAALLGDRVLMAAKIVEPLGAQGLKWAGMSHDEADAIAKAVNDCASQNRQ
jgi:preprotein translocase subunit SecD